LAIVGAVLLALGIGLLCGHRMPLGSLPGDIVIQREGFTLYFPVTTSLLLSAIVSLVVWLFFRE